MSNPGLDSKNRHFGQKSETWHVWPLNFECHGFQYSAARKILLILVCNLIALKFCGAGFKVLLENCTQVEQT